MTNDTILFTAIRGGNRALFRMSYVNRNPGEPELIKSLDSTYGYSMLFWDDADIQISVDD